MPNVSIYQATVKRWLDGDTCEVEVAYENEDLRAKVTLSRHVRVFGINAPEIHAQDESERKRGMEAKALAEKLAPPGGIVYVKSAPGGPTDKYGRWLAEITLADGRDFALVMTQAGAAKIMGPRGTAVKN